MIVNFHHVIHSDIELIQLSPCHSDIELFKLSLCHSEM